MTEADVYEFISKRKLAVLGSVAEDGSPQSALVGIAVTPALEIVFDTLKSSRKYPNLIARPACSFVIGWEGEQTLQFEGLARELNGGALETYQQVYFQAWPDAREHLKWAGLVYFVVRPTWIRYSDYDQDPPLFCSFR